MGLVLTKFILEAAAAAVNFPCLAPAVNIPAVPPGMMGKHARKR